MNHQLYLLILYTLIIPNTIYTFQNPTINKIITKKLTLKNKNKFNKTIKHFKQILTTNPNNKSTLIKLKHTYNTKNTYKKTTKTFKLTIKHHNKSINTHHYLTLTYLQKNNLKNTKKYTKKTTKITPKQ